MSQPGAYQDGSALVFFSLVFALSIPFYLAGAATERRLLPGVPVSALALICPAVSVLILAFRDAHAAGVIQLLRRAFDYRRIKTKSWYAPVILLPPVIAVVTYGVMRLTALPLPVPRFALLTAPVLFVALLVGATCEELGWSGFAIDRLQAHRSALTSGLVVGIVWAVWHWIPLLEAHRSTAWIAWWSLGTVASRVVMTWLYNNTGQSVFGAALYHAMIDLSWQLFPNHGSHWDPRINGLIVAAAAAIVTLVWGPRTLARYRNA